MKILLVEDQKEKATLIHNFIKEVLSPDSNLTIKDSLRGGLKELIASPYHELILLDMSLPNFEIENNPLDDYTMESFAGKEFLAQMYLRGIEIPVIIITQYSSFEGGTVSLDDLDKQFKRDFDMFYKGFVYFNSAVDTWKDDFKKIWETING